MVKTEFSLNIFYCFLSSLVAFVFVPLFMLGNSPEDYHFIVFPVFFKSGFLCALIFCILLGLICIILSFLRLHRLARIFPYFVLLWVLVTGLFLPVSVSTGMVDPENNPVDKVNLIVSIVIVGCLSIASMTAARRYITVFVLVALITSLVPTLVSVSNAVDRTTEKTKKKALSLSGKKNILVISFDGLPGNIIVDLIENTPTYSSLLKDFVVFSNAVSQSPATQASLMGELYGVHDYKKKGKATSDVTKVLKNEEVANKLSLNQVDDSYQYGYYSLTPVKKFRLPAAGLDSHNQIETFDFFRYSLTRLFTGLVLTFVDWDWVSGIMKPYIISDNAINLASRVQNSNGPKWDKKNIVSIGKYKSFVDNISVADKDISVRFLHFTFTHYPVDFDEYCRYRGDSKTWFKSNQNENGIRSQDKCALTQFSKFIRKLKELDIYDKSLIVFKSDHGKPVSYYKKYPNNQAINGNKMWGYNRYRPTLMIKDFGVNKPLVTIKTELVLLNDLAKTLCIKSNTNIDCKKVPGVDLLGDSLDSDEPYYLYVVKNQSSTFRFNDHVSVKVPSRKVRLIDAMKESKLISLSTHGEQSKDEAVVSIERKKPAIGTKNNAEFIKRLSDINNIKTALSRYYSDNGKYPISSGWDGIHTNWGESKLDYISGLVPGYMNVLPIDPRESNDRALNYLYRSNGQEYKFLVHGAPPYDLGLVDQKQIDPKRSTWAYGIWTEGAKNW